MLGGLGVRIYPRTESESQSLTGHSSCSQSGMTLHSRSKEQREAVRQLIYLVLTRDMATFNPDRFKHWIKETDSKFRKVGLMLKFEIRDRFVYFRIKEIRNGRIIYQFESSTRVAFDERDVVLSYEELNPVGR